MEKTIQKRRKGGGRKLADGKISSPRLKRKALKWFEYNTSVEDFLSHVGISRQTYYRFLDKNPKLKNEIFTLRAEHIAQHKAQIEEILLFFRENPNTTIIDYYDYKLELSLSKITNTPIVL